jgi:hypothetical protein
VTNTDLHHSIEYRTGWRRDVAATPRAMSRLSTTNRGSDAPTIRGVSESHHLRYNDQQMSG